jgi:hypothetical protein
MLLLMFMMLLAILFMHALVEILNKIKQILNLKIIGRATRFIIIVSAFELSIIRLLTENYRTIDYRNLKEDNY